MGEQEGLVAELLAGLKAADEALSAYACHAGPGVPCIRSKDQCLAECGNEAGDAIVTIAPLIAKAEEALSPS